MLMLGLYKALNNSFWKAKAPFTNIAFVWTSMLNKLIDYPNNLL